jgi:hypothetical protein
MCVCGYVRIWNRRTTPSAVVVPLSWDDRAGGLRRKHGSILFDVPSLEK